MQDGCIVVDIATGRRLRGADCAYRSSVAEMVEHIARSTCFRKRSVETFPSLSLRLDDLSGVSDETVARLANLALNGVITPASAARLAIRHALQLQTPTNRGRGRADRNFGTSRLQVAIAGDPFGDYALCYGPTEAGLWIGSAPVRKLDFLLEVCPKSGCGFFVLVGIDSRRRPVAGILDAIRHPRSLKDLLRTERWRFAEHLLVVGGQIPIRSRDQRLLLCDVREAMRRSGYARVIGSRATGAARPDGRCESPLAPDALLLLELAFPGLVACREQAGDPA